MDTYMYIYKKHHIIYHMFLGQFHMLVAKFPWTYMVSLILLTKLVTILSSNQISLLIPYVNEFHV